MSQFYGLGEPSLFKQTCPTCSLLSTVYRFVFTAVRGPGEENTVQLSRIMLYNRDGQPIPVVKVSSRLCHNVRCFQGTRWCPSLLFQNSPTVERSSKKVGRHVLPKRCRADARLCQMLKHLRAPVLARKVKACIIADNAAH